MVTFCPPVVFCCFCTSSGLGSFLLSYLSPSFFATGRWAPKGNQHPRPWQRGRAVISLDFRSSDGSHQLVKIYLGHYLLGTWVLSPAEISAPNWCCTLVPRCACAARLPAVPPCSHYHLRAGKRDFLPMKPSQKGHFTQICVVWWVLDAQHQQFCSTSPCRGAVRVAEVELPTRTLFTWLGLRWVGVVHGLLALLAALNCTWPEVSIAVQK